MFWRWGQFMCPNQVWTWRPPWRKSINYYFSLMQSTFANDLIASTIALLSGTAVMVTCWFCWIAGGWDGSVGLVGWCCCLSRWRWRWRSSRVSTCLGRWNRDDCGWSSVWWNLSHFLHVFIEVQLLRSWLLARQLLQYRYLSTISTLSSTFILRNFRQKRREWNFLQSWHLYSSGLNRLERWL